MDTLVKSLCKKYQDFCEHQATKYSCNSTSHQQNCPSNFHQQSCSCKSPARSSMGDYDKSMNGRQNSGQAPPDECYDISLIPRQGHGPHRFSRFFCPTSGGDTSAQTYHLCDNEAISLANTCGQITMSKQKLDTSLCPDLDELDKELDKETLDDGTEVKRQKKAEKKQGKKRYKECKKNAKTIYKKYKDREKQRAKNEKNQYKKCLKVEKDKVKLAKRKLKNKKKLAKEKMKKNKKKNKQKLKRLRQRLKQRCKELKTKDPNKGKTDSASDASFEFEDPYDSLNQPGPQKAPCSSYNSMNRKSNTGYRQPSTQGSFKANQNACRGDRTPSRRLCC